MLGLKPIMSITVLDVTCFKLVNMAFNTMVIGLKPQQRLSESDMIHVEQFYSFKIMLTCPSAYFEQVVLSM